jgi:hypothetical protein
MVRPGLQSSDPPTLSQVLLTSTNNQPIQAKTMKLCLSTQLINVKEFGMMYPKPRKVVHGLGFKVALDFICKTD